MNSGTVIFDCRYGQWATEHDAQLLELDLEGDNGPQVVGYLIQGTAPEDVPAGLHKLAIRADDTNSDPCELAECVLVNRYGWFFTEAECPCPMEIKDWNFVC